jgi:hypothetical protein
MDAPTGLLASRDHNIVARLDLFERDGGFLADLLDIALRAP